MTSLKKTKFTRLALSCFLILAPGFCHAAVAQTLTKNVLSTSAVAAKAGVAEMLKVSEDQTQGLTLSFTPVVQKSAVRINSKAYSRFHMESSGYVERYGYPRLPFVSRLVAIPDGMDVSVAVTKSAPRALTGVSVEPAPPPYEDNELYEAPPVKENAKAYASAALFPPKPYEFVETGRLRGVRVGVLRLYPLQYRAAEKKLLIHDNLEAQVKFQGTATATVKPKWTLSDSAVTGMLINKSTLGGLIQKYDFNSIPAVSLSEDYVDLEFLIVTHPDFKDAADALAEWKNEKGIKTIVRDLNTTGSTVAEIDEYVENTYDLCGGTLQYLMILGDSEYVPTDYYQVCADGDTTCTTVDIATDLPYAEFDGDVYPELAYGRIPANSLDEANAAVNKILSYEQDPPTGAFYYDNFTFAGYFQDNGSDGGADVANDGIDDRSYIQTQETIRDALVLEGKTVERIYTAGSTYLTTNPDGPQYYEGGVTPLPSEILVQYDAGGVNVGYAWDGNSTQITDDFNSNRSLLFHRDHGNWNGWSSPSFKYGDLAGLTNTDYPVLFSINCLTGRYDHETGWWSDQSLESFAEQALVLPDHGPASLVAASRATSTSRNNTMSKGLFDALWDSVVTDSSHPDASGGDDPILRLGDVLNYAKLYVTLHHSSFTEHFHHYYVAGDPTLEILRDPAFRFVAFDIRSWLETREALLAGRTVQMSVVTPMRDPRALVKLYLGNEHYILGKEVGSTVTKGGMKRTYSFDLAQFATQGKLWLSQVKLAPTSYPMRLSMTAPGYQPLRAVLK